MTQRTSRARRRSDRGFTLIELLVVIVILGILSAVVVFAVRGAGDKGKGAAVATDERTIRTAEEAYCAKTGQYATMDQLTGVQPSDIDGRTYKFLSERSTYHKVVTTSGPCGGNRYTILCSDGSPMPGCGAGPGPGSPPTCGPGTWCVATPPALGVTAYHTNSGMLQLSDGKIFTIKEVYDPAAGNLGSWKPAAPPTSSGYSTANTMVLLKGGPGQCKEKCGNVLVHFVGYPGEWERFDPTKVASDGKIGKWTHVTSNLTRNLHAAAVQLLDDPSRPGDECGTNCGKVLVAGGTSEGTDARNQSPPIAELYDPGSDSFTLGAGYGEPFPLNAELLLAPLKDGRVLLVAGPSAKMFDPVSGVFLAAAPPMLVHDATYDESAMLADGRVLVSANSNLTPGGAEIYDPAPFPAGSWTTVAPCGSSPKCHLLAQLPDDKVLAYASSDANKGQGATGETYVFSPATHWSRTGDLNDRSDGYMPTGGVLISGSSDQCGTNCNKVLAAKSKVFDTTVLTAELYTPP